MNFSTIMAVTMLTCSSMICFPRAKAVGLSEFILNFERGRPEQHLLASDLITCENLFCSHRFYFLCDFELVGQLLKPNENCRFGAQNQKLHVEFSSFVKIKVIEKEVVEVKKQKTGVLCHTR